MIKYIFVFLLVASNIFAYSPNYLHEADSLIHRGYLEEADSLLLANQDSKMLSSYSWTSLLHDVYLHEINHLISKEKIMLPKEKPFSKGSHRICESNPSSIDENQYYFLFAEFTDPEKSRYIIDSASCTNYYIAQTEAGKNVYEAFFDKYFVEKGGLRFFRHEGVIKLKPYVTELVFNKIYMEIKQGNFGEAKRLNKVLMTLFSNASNFQNNMLRKFNRENEIQTLDFYYLYWSQVKVNQHFDQDGSERNFINLVKQLSVLNFMNPEQSKFFLFLIEEEPQVKDQYEYIKVLHKATKSFLDGYGKKSYYYGKCMFLLAEHYRKTEDEENLEKAKEYLKGNKYFNSEGLIKEKK